MIIDQLNHGKFLKLSNENLIRKLRDFLYALFIYTKSKETNHNQLVTRLFSLAQKRAARGSLDCSCIVQQVHSGVAEDLVLKIVKLNTLSH